MPEPTQTLQLADGRRLAVDILGFGFPVVVFHGLPGSRLQRHPGAAPAAEAAGLKLLCYDRPGFGQSDPTPSRTITDSAADVRAILDRCSIDRCRILAWSGGGAHALAACHALPERIERALLINPMGPLETLADTARLTRGMLARNRLQLIIARVCPPLGKRTLRHVARAAAADVPAFVDTMLRNAPQADRRALHIPGVRAQMELDFAEAFAHHGSTGTETEAALLAQPWDVPLGHIATPIELWCATEDVHVAPAIVDRLARALPNATQRVFEGEGHFLFYERWAELMTALAQ